MSMRGEIIDIFVSSPGDVSKYRDSILSIVQSWNQRNAKSRGVFFNCIRWEDLVAPDIGESSQDVINQQIGDDYDIFLGVMWSRFGSKTANFESGTQEEFDRALGRHISGDSVKLSFLFCTADIPQKQLDGNQYANVQRFKKEIQEAGCLTRDFFDDASLVNAVNIILDRFANSWIIVDQSSAKKSSHLIVRRKSVALADVSSAGSDEDDDDDGVLDVAERFSQHIENFVGSMSQWVENFNSVSAATQEATEGLSQASAIGKPEGSQVRQIIKPMTDKMEDFADWCENKIVDLEKVTQDLTSDTLKMFELSKDFNEENADIEKAIQSLAELIETISSSNQATSNFVESLESLPRLDKKMNKACRRLVLVHKRLIAQNEVMRENMALGLNDLQQRLQA